MSGCVQGVTPVGGGRGIGCGGQVREGRAGKRSEGVLRTM